MRVQNKILLIVVCVAVLLLLYYVLVPRSSGPQFLVNAQLIVNEQPVGSKKNIAIYRYTPSDDYRVELPLAAVVEGLGCRVIWNDDGTAYMEVGDNTYFLSNFTISDNEGRIIIKDKGISASVLEKEGMPNDLFYDKETLKEILSKMGIPVEIVINPKDETVTVRGRKE